MCLPAKPRITDPHPRRRIGGPASVQACRLPSVKNGPFSCLPPLKGVVPLPSIVICSPSLPHPISAGCMVHVKDALAQYNMEVFSAELPGAFPNSAQSEVSPTSAGLSNSGRHYNASEIGHTERASDLPPLPLQQGRASFKYSAPGKRLQRPPSMHPECAANFSKQLQTHAFPSQAAVVNFLVSAHVSFIMRRLC